MVVTMEIFLTVKNPLILLLALPIHGICMLLCARDARFFDLAALWAQTRMLGLLANVRAWKGNSHSPLMLDPPRRNGRRRADPNRVPVAAMDEASEAKSSWARRDAL